MRTADFKHRCALCSAHDVNVDEIKVLLVRQKVIEFWGRIDPVRGSFMMSGHAERESRDNHSCLIWMRWAPSVDISGYAWVFEERKRSGCRWYKVLSVREENDASRFWRIEARLEERSGDAVRPVTDQPLGIFAPKPLTGVLP